MSNQHDVSADALPFEFMLNALRLADGFELQRFAERTGQSIAAIDATLRRAAERGLVEREGGRVKPTPRGFDFLSDLQQMFL